MSSTDLERTTVSEGKGKRTEDDGTLLLLLRSSCVYRVIAGSVRDSPRDMSICFRSLFKPTWQISTSGMVIKVWIIQRIYVRGSIAFFFSITHLICLFSSHYWYVHKTEWYPLSTHASLYSLLIIVWYRMRYAPKIWYLGYLLHAIGRSVLPSVIGYLI